jgi:phosphomannomutase/phosphoglucomutase
MNREIFRQYDIRGVVDKDFTAADALDVGRAVGTHLVRRGKTRVTVGQDCRLSSPEIAKKVAAGLMRSGCSVINLGVCPTPAFYYSVRRHNAGGGIMVTASHNPPEYNGFKICRDTETIFGDEILEIARLIEARDFAEGQGSFVCAEITEAYQQQILDSIRIERPLRVGIDAGNGTAGPVALPVLERLGCEVHPLYCDMDGRFPNHEPDPTVLANMRDLSALVREKHLDVGIGYDGDSDRIGVVDENGRIVHGDMLMLLFARDILKKSPGATFLSEVKCSQILYDEIARLGGRALMWKTGHSLIKQKMREENAALAGEMSGHIFFADRYFGFDDAIYASCRLVELLAQSGKGVAELLKDVPRTYNTPEIRVDCPDSEKFAVVARVTEYFKARREVIDIDGARVLFGDGWGLVRASNTQPVLVLRFEALTGERLGEIRDEVEGVVRRESGRGGA